MRPTGPNANDELADPSTDNRSPAAKAASFVSKITTASMMLVLPAWGGWWLDQQLGTVVLFLFLGMLIGMAAAGWQLYKLTLIKPTK